ncbi:MAG: glucose 1-dehydrogenase [Novosphingobium sp.]|uniref:SDR family NAD(P)-dependent oxidoreductase n=1 Tax=Novosphingobium sp. TaxID=1874826 RepID=UPI002734C73D|nr:glucose 1-dehydrogenase [Novosphingobium sp.]MDP3550770.1 glucose 1-dehydrogenase [Novosphingobium sp.]
MTRLHGRTAIVTGAARGLGAGIAQALAEDGAAVVLADVLPQVNDTAAALASAGHRTLAVHLDVTSEENWHLALTTAVQSFGEVSILVNNAGITINKDFESVSIDEFRKILDVNLLGAFRGMQAVLPSMKRAGGGAIINVASTTTDQILSIAPCYGASKSALANLTKSAALHCAEQGYGIRVNSVHPGTHATPMVMGDGMATEHPAARAIIEAIPMKRMGQPLELGRVVAFLASQDASYMTGAEVFSDGGAVIT